MAETSRNNVRKKDLGSISLVIDPVKEQEADRQAVAILREAGYDPHAMAAVPSIKIAESLEFQAAKRDLAAELSGW